MRLGVFALVAGFSENDPVLTIAVFAVGFAMAALFVAMAQITVSSDSELRRGKADAAKIALLASIDARLERIEAQREADDGGAQ